MRLARRDAMRSKGRTALIAALVALPVLVGAVAITLFASATPTQERQMNWVLGPSAQARVTWEGQAPLVQGLAIDAGRVGYYVPDERVADLSASLSVSVVEERVRAALPAGSTVTRTWDLSADVTGATAVPEHVAVKEVDAATMAGLVTLGEGRLPESTTEAVIATGVADRLGSTVGSTIVVAPTTAGGDEPLPGVHLRVVGIYDVPGAGADVMATLGSVLDDGRTALRPDFHFEAPSVGWFVSGSSPVTWEDVQRLNDLGAAVISRDVVANPPAQVAFGDLDDDGGSTYSASTLAIAGAVIVFGLFELVMLIGPAFAVGARRNERQLALVAAVGGDRRTMRRIVVLGGVVIGGVASLVAVAGGITVAAVVRWVLNQRYVYTVPEWHVPVIPLVALAALGTLLAVAAAWMPARRASRMDVVAALAHRRSISYPRRRASMTGLAVLALGLVAAVAGAVVSISALMIAGVVAILSGVVVLSGGVLVLIARLAPRLGPAGRYAARDAVRQHARTAPALAAIIAAAAGVVAAGTFVESKDAYDAGARTSMVGEGHVVVGVNAGIEGGLAQEMIAALESSLPLARLREVRTATVDPAALSEEDAAAIERGELYYWLRPTVDPATVCPLYIEGAIRTEAMIAAHADDPRCTGGENRPTAAMPWSGMTATIVDDGTLVSDLGVPGAAEAAEALRQGKILVSHPDYVWPDGRARIVVGQDDMYGPDGSSDGGETVALTAFATTLPLDLDVILPTAAAARLGLVTESAGYLGIPTREITVDEERAARDVLAAITRDAGLEVERGFQSDSAVYYSLLLAAAVVVGAGATGIVLALSSAETRPDMATLGAIGAPPALRRRVAAAQAALVTAPGLVLGSVVGVAFAWVLVLTRQQESGGGSWPFTVPWLELGVMVVGVPLVVMGGAYVLTRSRLPMIRRLVD